MNCEQFIYSSFTVYLQFIYSLNTFMIQQNINFLTLNTTGSTGAATRRESQPPPSLYFWSDIHVHVHRRGCRT